MSTTSDVPLKHASSSKTIPIAHETSSVMNTQQHETDETIQRIGGGKLYPGKGGKRPYIDSRYGSIEHDGHSNGPRPDGSGSDDDSIDDSSDDDDKMDKLSTSRVVESDKQHTKRHTTRLKTSASSATEQRLAPIISESFKHVQAKQELELRNIFDQEVLKRKVFTNQYAVKAIRYIITKYDREAAEHMPMLLDSMESLLQFTRGINTRGSTD